MEKRVNDKIVIWTHDFKLKLKDMIENKNDDYSIIEFLMDYEVLQLSDTDFKKRKRTRNTVPLYERCIAKRANGQQCTRRKKGGDNHFCGTHEKGTPHGVINDDKIKQDDNTQIEVVAHDINGIIYYIDDNKNVYNTEDVLKNVVNPKVIAKYEKDVNGEISIPSIFS